jgi:YfiH family protein
MRTVIEPSNIDSLNVRAFFSTKGFVKENEKVHDVLSKELDIPSSKIYLPIQKHTNKVYVVNEETRPVVADAVITTQKKLLIGVLVADCVPVLLFDKKKEVAGAVHAGWRGTAGKILKYSIDTMKESFNCDPGSIMVAIGPSIRQCSYEVSAEVKDGVIKTTGEGDYYYQKGDKYYIDLSAANMIQALGAGIPENNIWQSEECTDCNPDKFYSYRYSKGKATGRQGGFIGMW